MRRAILPLFALALASSGATAQVRIPFIQGRQPPAPVLTGIDALRADFRAKAGSDTIYFGLDSAILGGPARATLAAQAQWLRQHPDVVVRVEGHGEPNDTRDHALAMGAQRAQGVRDYLVLLGVPAAQLSTTSFGKEQPGAPRAVTILVR